MKGYSLIPMALFSAVLTLPAAALAAVPMEAAIAESANPSALQEGALQNDSAAQLATQSGAVDMPEENLQPEDQEQDYATAGAAVGTVTVATARAPNHDVAAMAEENMAEENMAEERVAEANGADVADPTIATAAPAANQRPATLNQQHSSPDYNPLIQGEANRGNVSPADLSVQPAPNTLQKKVKGPHGELLATQPGEVQVQENRRFKAP